MTPPSSIYRTGRFARLSRRQRLTLVGMALALAVVITLATVVIILIPNPPAAPNSTVPGMHFHPLITTPLTAPSPGLPAAQQWSNAGPDFAQVITFAPSAPSTGYACGSAGRAGRTLALGMTRDGGKTWNALSTNVVGQTCALSVAPAAPNDIALAVAQCPTTCATPAAVALYRSSDGGATWAQATLPQGGFGLVLGWAGTTLFAVTNDPMHPLAVSVGGQPFALQDDLARFPGQIDFLGAVGTTMYAELAAPTGGSPTVAQSSDGGMIWSQVTLSDPPFPITFARPSADGKWLIGLEQTDTLVLSGDGGQRWQSEPAFPSGQTLTASIFVARAPDGSLVALTHAAHLSSTTQTLITLAPGASTWQPFAANLPASTTPRALTWDSHGHPLALWATSSAPSATAKQLWAYLF